MRGGHLQCTPPSHCCQRLRKTRRRLGVGQTPAVASSMNSRDGVKLNGLWFIFCAKSIRSGEERRGEESCPALCGEQCGYSAGCHVWTDLVICTVWRRMGVCGEQIDVTEMGL